MLRKHGARRNWYKGKGRRENEMEVEKRGNKKRIEKGLISRGVEEVEAVCFVPATPGGELAKRLQEGDDVAREGTKQKKLKFIERGEIRLEIGCAETIPGGK